MTNRISPYLNPSKLVPSAGMLEQSFDDFMVRGMAATLQDMLRRGLGTKDELLYQYSEQRFSVNGPLYRKSIMLDDLEVTPRMVFAVDYARAVDTTTLVKDALEQTDLTDEDREDSTGEWGLIFDAFAEADHFAIWRMAQIDDDIEDSVGIYGAFCSLSDDGNGVRQKYVSKACGIIMAYRLEVMLKTGMLQPIGKWA